jgi:hypothetical protein
MICLSVLCYTILQTHTYFFQIICARSVPINSKGLQNYWPILNGNMLDYIGGAHMTPIVNVNYIPDRFNNPKSALYLNSGSCSVPAGVYFKSPFSILVWVNPQQTTGATRILDFSSGTFQNNVIFQYGLNPQFGIFYGTTGAQSNYLTASIAVNVSRWTHLAAVYDGSMFFLYIDSTLQGSRLISTVYSNPPNPVNVVRQNCYIGRSAWYPNDVDAMVFIDDLKIYNRALSQVEIAADMN